jgi:hypothetical protein
MFLASAFTAWAAVGGWGSCGRSSGLSWSRLNGLISGSGRLSLIGAKQAVFERSAIEPADDGIHFFRVRGIDESEALRFLGLRIPNHLDIIVHEVLCVEPRLDVVFGDPDREVSEENSKAHLLFLLTP